MSENNFIDKTTLIKDARPHTLKVELWKDGFKVSGQIKIDLDNSIDMDKLMEKDPKKNEYMLAIRRMIEIWESFGYKHLADE
jgi:hypothetical protein